MDRQQKAIRANRWWGYKHIIGGLQVKRFYDIKDIQEARDSDFVEQVAGPFYAANREEALAVLSTYFEIG